MSTRYRIVQHSDPGSGSRWFHPEKRTWWSLGFWLPLTIVGECTQEAAQRRIDLSKGTAQPRYPKVVHEETAP